MGSVISNLPYSSELAPYKFFLFSKMKIKLKGKRFDDREDSKGVHWTMKRLTRNDL